MRSLRLSELKEIDAVAYRQALANIEKQSEQNGLPEGYKDWALRNDMVVSGVFKFAQTPEGRDYWTAIVYVPGDPNDDLEVIMRAAK